MQVPDEEPLTNILTNISGKTGRNGSRVGEIEPLEKAAQTALNAASRLRLSQSGDSETLVEVAGIETELSKLLIRNHLQLISFSCLRFAS
jgi:hypothetical protein